MPDAAAAGVLVPADGALLDEAATLGEAAERVCAGEPLLLLRDAGGRLVATVEPLAVRIAVVSGADPTSPVVRVARRIDGAGADGGPPAQVEVEVLAAGAAPGPRPDRLGPVARVRPVVDADGRPVALRAVPAKRRIERAVVMAGGLGKRLRPLTESVPKPLVEVGGTPLLGRMLGHLERYGVGESVVSVRYLAEAVEAFVAAGGGWSHAVRCLREEEALGTAGTLGLLDSAFRGGPFFLVNGDIVTDVDLDALAAHHLASGAAVTVATVRYEWRIPYGVVEPEGPRLAAVREKPLYRFETNAGVYAFDPRALAGRERGAPCDMVELINGLADGGDVVARFPLVEYWSDVGNPGDLERVRREVADGGGDAVART